MNDWIDLIFIVVGLVIWFLIGVFTPHKNDDIICMGRGEPERTSRPPEER